MVEPGSPTLSQHVETEKPLDVGPLQISLLDADNLRLVRGERTRSLLPPASGIDEEIHSRPWWKLTTVPGHDWWNPQQPLTFVRSSKLWRPSGIRGCSYRVGRKTTDRDVIGVKVESIGIERDHDRRLFSTNGSDERTADFIRRRRRQLLILVRKDLRGHRT